VSKKKEQGPVGMVTTETLAASPPLPTVEEVAKVESDLPAGFTVVILKQPVWLNGKKHEGVAVLPLDAHDVWKNAI
jgi:hypothetical protein